MRQGGTPNRRWRQNGTHPKNPGLTRPALSGSCAPAGSRIRENGSRTHNGLRARSNDYFERGRPDGIPRENAAGSLGPAQPVLMPARIAGCDISTYAVDVVTLPIDPRSRAGLRHERFAMRSRSERAADKSFPAIFALRGRVPAAKIWDGVQVAFIERGFGTSRRSDWLLGRVQGAFAVLVPESVWVYEVMLTEWKGELTGNGNASKEHVQETLRSLGYDEQPDNNVWDALGIAHAIRGKYARKF